MNNIFFFYLKAVNNKLFTGSFDGSLRVWSLEGMTLDQNSAKEKPIEKNVNKELDEISVENETAPYNRSRSTDQNPNNRIKVKSKGNDEDYY